MNSNKQDSLYLKNNLILKVILKFLNVQIVEQEYLFRDEESN